MLAAAIDIPTVDLIVIVVYLVGIVALGIWTSHARNVTSQQYFLAGRSLRWGMVGAALFATNISTIHLVGLAEGASRRLVGLGEAFDPDEIAREVSALAWAGLRAVHPID